MDGSFQELGAVLAQEQDEIERGYGIAYASRSLPPTEINGNSYNSFNLELGKLKNVQNTSWGNRWISILKIP